MKELKTYLRQLVDFSEQELDIIINLFTEKKIKKGDYFAKEGELSTKMGFIVSGVLRAFFRSMDGNEYNKTFFTASSFAGAYSALITNTVNQINIQCLVDTELYTFEYKSFVKLYEKHPNFERLSRILAENKFIQKEKREIELVTLNASERYEIFRKEHPKLENIIPLYHIASYLGITPTQLSRIRAKK